MRVLIACALLMMLLTASACSPGSSGGGNGNFTCPSGNDGILLIDWTVRGAPASSVSCAGITKLSLYLSNPVCGQVEIDPIQCTLDKFRYDELPEGQAEVILQGVDSRGVVQIAGSAMVDLTKTLPSTETPVALD